MDPGPGARTRLLRRAGRGDGGHSFGFGLAGWASDVFGARSIFAAAGLVMVAGAVFLVWAFRAYRRDLEELEAGAQGPTATVEQTSPSAS